MEALAAKQLKRQQAATKDANLSPATLQRSEQDVMKERLELNRMLGFPDPPAQVFALGKEECAAVWWSEPNDDTITGWEVHRFRKDRSKPEADVWQYKGFISYTNLLKTQVVVNQLTNEYEYRFAVKANSSKGTGAESAPSNPVMVEKPLPTGW
jgi:hypothetical protein